MPLSSREVSEKIPAQSLGSLKGCLVQGDADQRSRERRVRRRSLAMSILIQTAVLALLILLPLFGKTQRIALAIATPIPPYGHPPQHSAGTTRPRPEPPTNPGNPYIFRTPTNRPVSPSNTKESPIGPPGLDPGGIEGESGPECSWCINIGGKNGPRPPQPVIDPTQKTRVVRMTTLDPAMLLRRIEPVYPPLARQIHKEGRVELRAIIASDGSIQSLEVLSGDPLFYQSALEAVRQWHYKPTILNGQAVEIDTHITVIYTMQH
jgi:periplasmic protein TonB